MTPEAVRMVSPGSGIPTLSSNTPKKTTRYPYWPIKERIWSMVCYAY
jgi:hypothetical protein